jgi:SAM-dependent methyltransferase
LSTTLPLPVTTIRSAGDFLTFRKISADLLDERYRREQSIAVSEPSLSLDGCCGVCLLPTTFLSRTEGGTQTSDGRLVPNWREQQACACGRALNNRTRALLQLALSRGGGEAWCRAALLGPDDTAGRAATEMLGVVQRWPRFAKRVNRPSLPADAASVHLVVCADQLQFVPPLELALAELARVLLPGGSLLFTVPFDIGRGDTVSSSLARVPMADMPTLAARPVHDFGWSLLPIVERAGFSHCTAHCYWSEEFGYLGPFNMIFEAER